MEPQFGILGPLQAAVAGRRLELGGPKPRRLLAMLLVHAGRVLSVDRLVEGVWEDGPPSAAEVTLRAHVARLRRALAAAGADDVVVTRAPGYGLAVDRERIDAHRFERLAAEGGAALDGGEPDRAARVLREGLGLWRGAVLEDLGGPRFAEAEAARLDELRLVAVEARLDADLALGRHRELVAELEVLVGDHPFRERLCGQLMLALYRSGRQADALEAFRTARHRLDEELGLAPGRELADLQAAILRHDPALAVPCEATMREPVAGEPRPQARAQAPSDALFDLVRRVPMVGRVHELERLQGLWQAVREGGRRVGLVCGEAGVGKTRLVADLVDLVTGEGAALLVGHCDQAALVPYQPVSDALRRSPQAGDALAQAPDPLARRLAPLLDRSGDTGAREPLWSGEPDAQQAAFLDAVGQLFARMTASVPVVFVVEDAESIDRASARLLAQLARHLPERLLLVVCFRDPPGSRHPPLRELLADLEGRGLADRVALSPLSEHDLAALVAAWTGTRAPAPFLEALWSSTGGNPFYAGEVVGALATRGSFDHLDAWRVPPGLRDVLRERLQALSADARDVIASAAVLGREMDLGLLATVTGQPDDRIVSALEEAGRAGWLVETGRAWEARYAFRHALMREAVHADMPAPRRQQLHLRAADALEADGLRRPGDVAAAAVHLRAAGRLADRTRAAEASLRAADEAAAVYAWHEAVAHAEAAVAILANAGASPALQGRAAERAARLLERSSLDYQQALEYLEAALDHFRAAGDETAIASALSFLGNLLTAHHSVMDIPRALECFAAAEPAVGSDEAAFELHLGKAQAALFGLRTDQGCAAAQQALEQAEQLGRSDLTAMARSMLGCHRFSRGGFAGAWTLIDEAWATAHRLGDPYLSWVAVFTGAWLNNVFLLDPSAGEAWCRRGLTQPRFATILHARESVRDHLAYALAEQGQLDAAREVAAGLPADAVSRRLLLVLDGEWEAAEASLADALAHDLDHGDLLSAAHNGCWLGQVRRLLGRVAGAGQALRRALALSVEGPHVPLELMTRTELARLLAAAGDPDGADEHVARCDRLLAGGEDWRGQAGTVELARAAVAAGRGRYGHADEAYGRALTVFTTYQLPWKRAETLLEWARCLTGAHRAVAADEKRVAAWTAYDELGAPARWQRPESMPT